MLQKISTSEQRLCGFNVATDRTSKKNSLRITYIEMLLCFLHYRNKRCNTLKDKFIVFQFDVKGWFIIVGPNGTHVTVKGYPSSNINTHFTPSGSNIGIYSRYGNGHKGAECHTAKDCTKYHAAVVAIWPFERVEL